MTISLSMGFYIYFLSKEIYYQHAIKRTQALEQQKINVEDQFRLLLIYRYGLSDQLTNEELEEKVSKIQIDKSNKLDKIKNKLGEKDYQF